MLEVLALLEKLASGIPQLLFFSFALLAYHAIQPLNLFCFGIVDLQGSGFQVLVCSLPGNSSVMVHMDWRVDVFHFSLVQEPLLSEGLEQ